MKHTWVARTAALRRWLGRATEPQILFPAISVVVLAVIWGTTLNRITVDRAEAERAAVVSGRGLAETYEAQVVRALREIDQTLKFVKYAHELGGNRDVLQELKARGLLPPNLLFDVSVADRNGNVVASTRPSVTTGIADQDYFRSQRETDALAVGRPRQSPGSREWKLEFSRRLNAPDGSFSGIVMVSVDAAYFVSGYESAKLGEHGVLAMLGTDGVFRATRTGEAFSAGDRVNYAAVVPPAQATESEATLTTNPWDGVRRYTSARQLYEFPLAVVVGLSAEEQLATTRRDTQAYLWRASGGSVLLLLVVALLGRMSRQLSLIRSRADAEQIAHAARVEYLAYHDGLTTLPNRSLFNKILTQSLSEAHRNNRQLAVLFLDLDLFKNINDTLGHQAGDQLLQEIATRLKDCLRDSDTVARLGGDEFVALLPELDEEKYVATVAEKLISAVARPFVLFGQEFRVTASVGISIYPQDGEDAQTLKKNADIAMYQAKQSKNNFQFYSRKLDADTLEKHALESALRQALERSEFDLHYQAKREIRSGRIAGMEALLVWQHPGLGTVAPMQFIPVAEENGLIVPIGKWALMTACRRNVSWQNQGLPILSMTVNLTARQFYDENLLSDLAAILADTGMAASLLELEIAENLLMRDAERAVQIFTQLKTMGIRIAIDAFGAGYSSLSALGQFPLDTIKIDASIIGNIATVADNNKVLTGALVAVAMALGLTVVVQGVDTKERADVLSSNVGDEFRGFYLEAPLPANQVEALLRAQVGIAAGNAHATGV